MWSAARSGRPLDAVTTGLYKLDTACSATSAIDVQHAGWRYGVHCGKSEKAELELPSLGTAVIIRTIFKDIYEYGAP